LLTKDVSEVIGAGYKAYIDGDHGNDDIVVIMMVETTLLNECLVSFITVATKHQSTICPPKAWRFPVFLCSLCVWSSQVILCVMCIYIMLYTVYYFYTHTHTHVCMCVYVSILSYLFYCSTVKEPLLICRFTEGTKIEIHVNKWWIMEYVPNNTRKTHPWGMSENTKRKAWSS